MAMVESRYGPCASHGFFLLRLLLPFLFFFSFIDVPPAAAATTTTMQSPPLTDTQKSIMNDIASLVNSESASANTRWNAADNPCKWTGISCRNSSSFSAVTSISLSNYGLSDSSIFAHLCRLGTLQSLDLSRNSFTNLSAQFFANSSCSMKEGLQSLNLNTNQLANSLSDLSHFPQLEVLDLSFNSFASRNLSADLGYFPKLRSFNASTNKLSGDVPTSMVGSLLELVLSGNQLSGSIPLGLFRYENLTLLDLSQNYLTGPVPDEFMSLPKLETLLLSGNKLIGEIPASLSNVTTLSRFAANQNYLTGPIASWITKHVCNTLSMTSLELDGNQLIGNIPPELGGCKSLSLLNLASNNLNGSVPDSIGKLDKLVVLKLQKNNLSGPIPSTFSDLKILSTLNLSENSLSGEIPSGIFELPKLSNLYLQGNNISGPIPISISSSKYLIELNLGDNALTGTIPTMPTTVTTSLLNLSHNHLNGHIPSNIYSLSELEILDLSHNYLSGDVPSSLGSLQSLTLLELSYNNLSGPVPRFRPNQNLDIDVVGNPGLVNGTENNNGKKKRHYFVIIIFTIAGALVGLCVHAVIIMILSKRIYRVEERIPAGEGVAQIINGSFITMNCFRTSVIMFMKEKQDEWRITAFQTLNFEAADILQGLNEENLVGSGGSGQVYRVTYTNRYNRSIGVVAVKQIRSFGSLDELMEHEFESEASILCNIRHNNIVKLLCCFSGTDSKLLVYDYMDNGSLDRWLHGNYVLRAGHPMARVRPVQRVPLDWPTRLIVAVGAAQGLCYMHHHCSPPIIHRDVKTSNILLDSEFRAKVADFGLARMLMQAGEPNTMTWVVGSFGYMAPEYAYTRKVNEKVDVFGFGVVLLELTTDKNANDGGDHGSLAEWAGHHSRSGASIPDATDICIRYAGYADEIETVFRLGVKCTANSPSSRPTMEDVLQILLKCSEQTLRKSRLECTP
ncbi:unnamed protein product [Miscanthus lutarioriparius]|uniref:Protein kinase domain-containing protein n=1 Tax=Miscanthus lutarioriparius TaxID=422564 RepID=A0A811RE39_9POAL|nr:unnamed protein product [Miscanthus lutarioriparius]